MHAAKPSRPPPGASGKALASALMRTLRALARAALKVVVHNLTEFIHRPRVRLKLAGA